MTETVESSADANSAFYAATQAGSTLAPGESVEDTPDGESGTQVGAILVVSSDESLLFTRKLILSRAGLAVYTATDLPKALRAALDYHPAVVLLGHTLRDSTQWSYFQNIESAVPGMCFACLKESVVHPLDLLRACQAYISEQPIISRMTCLG